MNAKLKKLTSEIESLRGSLDRNTEDAENVDELIRGETKFQKLFAKLSDPNGVNRAEAVGELGKLRDPRVTPHALRLLADHHQISVREAAAEVVAMSSSTQATDALVQAAGDPDPSLRGIAVRLLGMRTLDTNVARCLMEVLDDRIPEVKGHAVQSLLKQGVPPPFPWLHQNPEWMVEIRHPLAYQPNIDRLKSSHVIGRKIAAMDLGRLGGPLAEEPLTQALADQDEGVRAAAEEALKRMRSAKPMPVDLLERLWAQDGATRLSAAISLRHLGHPRTAAALMAATWGQNPLLRFTVTRALGELRASRGVPTLIAVLGDQDKRVRMAAAISLGEIGDLAATPSLILALADPEEAVRYYAAEALGNVRASAPSIGRSLGQPNPASPAGGH